MGTDIHGVWQAKKGSEWVDIPSTYNQRRHYMLFALLGKYAHEILMPIAEGRGYPNDFLIEGYHEHPITDPNVKDKMYIWMGDYGHSYVYADEILEAELPVLKLTGILFVETYKEWDKVSQPECWLNGLCGKDIKISAPDDIDDDTTHVQVEWEVDCADEFAYFIDEVKRLNDEYGEVRFVFGFDS